MFTWQWNFVEVLHRIQITLGIARLISLVEMWNVFKKIRVCKQVSKTFPTKDKTCEIYYLHEVWIWSGARVKQATREQNWMHLKDSDDADLCMLIFFWTLPIVLVFKIRRFGDWICLLPQVNRTPTLILFTWRWRQIQSPKRRALKARTIDVQKINIYKT
jgi:hypothetical protein